MRREGRNGLWQLRLWVSQTIKRIKKEKKPQKTFYLLSSLDRHSFGVCCVFVVSNSGKEVNQNCSYIRNEGFPNSFTGTSGVSHTIKKCTDLVCSIRLDFESFTILGTGNTFESATAAGAAPAGGECLDTFSVTVSAIYT